VCVCVVSDVKLCVSVLSVALNCVCVCVCVCVYVFYCHDVEPVVLSGWDLYSGCQDK
jgi:hypothetical protein